ncbi:MAG: threonine--tRNA ligase [Candidatus Nanosyncoccus sp. P13S_S20_bin.18.1]|nr:threonine--tRNA ligase [Candidatus Nanosyncoccus sp. P13S_S20_bin.18.1]
MCNLCGEDEQNVMKMRHTLSHVLAAALVEMYPGVQFGVGPATATGFYYDIDLSEVKDAEGNVMKITDADLPKIQKKMYSIINKKFELIYSEKSREEALAWAKENHQKYKVELIEDLPESEIISFYQLGEFTDLCKGPHVENTGKVGAFKLIKVAGAYWRGDEKREMLTRIYGVAFETEEELKEYLQRLEEAKARDHRKLGKELDLFSFSELVGAGLPLFSPRGTVLRDVLTNYSLSLRARHGFERVWTPHITKLDLYKASGHYAKFGAELFLVHSQVNGEEFALKPMNCPHHAQIFASRPRTYKEMPVRYMESTTDYRDEKSGELGGLSRVRSLTQDDTHVFCRKEQIKAEIQNLVGIVRELYTVVGMSKLRARLSYRNDEDKYLGDKSLWEMAQAQIKEAAIENGLDYFEMEGEAAFYGPKIDFMAEDAIGREHQVATIQLDFVQPERFGLTFVNENGEKEQPVMIHHATLGSIERFMSVFIEHTSGWFPFWCAPEQVRILTVNDQVLDYVEKIKQILSEVTLETPLKHNDLRYTADVSDESLGKKIKRAVSMKTPVLLIVGERDKENGTVSVREKDAEKTVALTELAEYLQNIK